MDVGEGGESDAASHSSTDTNQKCLMERLEAEDIAKCRVILVHKAEAQNSQGFTNIHIGGSGRKP